MALVVAVLGTAGCAEAATTSAAGSYRNLPTSGVWTTSSAAAYTPPAGVTIVERDSTDRPAKGKYNICYVNGFQTQPEDASTWKESYPSAILRERAGKPVSDPGWPDEMLLDTRTAAKRALITKVLAKTVARCA